MNTKTLSTRALSVIDQYLHFKVDGAVCSVPYFNNKSIGARVALRSEKGKGSPREIFDEIKTIITKNHVDVSTITGELLKKTLTDNNIGIDCSAFAYYILNAECEEMKKSRLETYINFVNCKGIFGKIRCSLRPIENCDVATFAHDKNSTLISINAIQPGDTITMLGGPDNTDRNHILVVHQIEYQNFIPTRIHYSHSVAYPEDGVYGTGIKQGIIEIIKPDVSIVEQIWTEGGKTGESNRIFVRAQKSKTELRRLTVFS